MKTIIIPADLSKESENAFSYAVDFALTVPEKIKLILLHVFETSVANVDTTASLLLSDLEEMEQATKVSLDQMAKKYLHATGINCSIVTSRGFLDIEIAAAAIKYKADFVFMGTSGAQGFFSGILGSNTSGVITKSPCPVLAIPARALFSPLRKIIFASNFSDNDTNDFKTIVNLAELYKATIVLLHISDKDEEIIDLQVLEFVRKQLKAETGYQRIEIEAIHANNFVNGVESEINKQQASLLVMAPKKHGFMDKILGRSRTRQVVLQTKTPMLALPVEGFHPELLTEKDSQFETVEF